MLSWSTVDIHNNGHILSGVYNLNKLTHADFLKELLSYAKKYIKIPDVRLFIFPLHDSNAIFLII